MEEFIKNSDALIDNSKNNNAGMLQKKQSTKKKNC